MWECPSDGTNGLPSHDPDLSKYGCGSDEVNTAVYAAMSIESALVIALVLAGVIFVGSNFNTVQMNMCNALSNIHNMMRDVIRKWLNDGNASLDNKSEIRL